jgi:MFS family permease
MAVGAVSSPVIGRMTDRIGGRKTLAAVFALSGLGMLGLAAAPDYWWLIVAAAVGGFGQAAANPGTNKLISVHVALGRRGVLTGLKQSGVQVGVFLAGVLLPAGALAWGWRPTLAVAGIASTVGLGLVWLVVPADPPSTDRRGTGARVAWSRPVLWLSAYGFLMGAAVGAVNTYLPLYGEEGLGLSVSVAGAVAGFSGLTAFFSRIVWARHSERSAAYIRTLAQIAALSVLFTGLLLVAPDGGVWLLWVGALGLGASAIAWNAVGMLAVMAFAGHEHSGGASGVVLLGFLTGLGLGPPLFGWSVDRAGSYGPGFLGALVAFGVAATLAVSWERATGRQSD